MTVADINNYLAAVDLASDRVVVAKRGRIVEGLPINYAVIVGDPARLADLQACQERHRRADEPQATPAEVTAAAGRAPVILWVAANVHGGEESGADASLPPCTSCLARRLRRSTRSWPTPSS